MKLFSKFLFALTLLVSSVVPSMATTHASSSLPKPAVHEIDDARATEIQMSLIKAGYLNGSASGHWDSATELALHKYQSDNGWQTKLVPDARAIIKLGLGPSSDTEAINAPIYPVSQTVFDGTH